MYAGAKLTPSCLLFIVIRANGRSCAGRPVIACTGAPPLMLSSSAPVMETTGVAGRQSWARAVRAGGAVRPPL